MTAIDPAELPAEVVAAVLPHLGRDRENMARRAVAASFDALLADDEAMTRGWSAVVERDLIGKSYAERMRLALAAAVQATTEEG